MPIDFENLPPPPPKKPPSVVAKVAYYAVWVVAAVACAYAGGWGLVGGFLAIWRLVVG